MTRVSRFLPLIVGTGTVLVFAGVRPPAHRPIPQAVVRRTAGEAPPERLPTIEQVPRGDAASEDSPIARLRAIQFSRDPRISAALVARLSDDVLSIRAAAAHALGNDAADALLDRFPVERDPSVRKAIVSALGRQRDPRAPWKIWEILLDSSCSVLWLAAARGLERAPRGLWPSMEQLLKQLRREPEHSEVAAALELSLKAARGETQISLIEGGVTAPAVLLEDH